MKDTAWVPKHKYILALLKKENNENAPICIMPTCFFSVNRYKVNAYQIIKGKQKNKGIVHYYNTLDFKWNVDSENRHIGVEYKKTKGQLEGYVRANYYLLDEKPDTIELGEAVHSYGYIPKNWEYIQIGASAFLWDLKKPLKYGLQNAFDGNPATSFVENTENDLIEISLSKGFQEKIRIINGYAANQKLYDKNNCVKQIGIYDYSKPIAVDGHNFVTPIKTQDILCDAHNLDWQEFKLSGAAVFLKVEDVYKGQMYNDTCIAEIDFCNKKSGWLFGGVN